MDEDVVGLSRVVVGNEYGACARCGAPVRRPRAVPGQKRLRAGDEEELCQRCFREALNGEPADEILEE